MTIKKLRVDFGIDWLGGTKLTPRMMAVSLPLVDFYFIKYLSHGRPNEIYIGRVQK